MFPNTLIYFVTASSCYVIDDRPSYIDLSIFQVSCVHWPHAFNNHLIYFLIDYLLNFGVVTYQWGLLNALKHLQRGQGNSILNVLFY